LRVRAGGGRGSSIPQTASWPPAVVTEQHQ
jgi:hypothetical protein